MVRDARGSVTLKSSFGAIEAANVPKGIHAVTGNGGITLTDIGGDTFAKTSFGRDRKSTRLNSSHSQISYAVFCLKKKNKAAARTRPATLACPRDKGRNCNAV